MPTQPASRADAAPPTGTVEFVVGGMTCGSCAARVQRALAKTDGVADAEVNLATSRARVRLARPVEAAALQARVAKLGATASPRWPTSTATPPLPPLPMRRPPPAAGGD